MTTLSLLTPRRMRGSEHLDDPGADSALAIRSLADVRRANHFLGGTGAVLSALRPVFDAHARRAAALSMLDVGTGAGDIPAAARALAGRCAVALRTTGVEHTLPVAKAAAPACGTPVGGDALHLPFAERSFDITTCSQVLHHFRDDDAMRVVRELHRVTRLLVVIGDLRRSWWAAAGIWLASWPLAFHPVSRHDGVVSVLRGYSADELGTLVHAATGVRPLVRRRPGFRLVASWVPT